MSEWIRVNEYKWMNTSEQIRVNEYEWIDTNEWIQVNEYECMNTKWMNMSTWIRVHEFEWMTTSEWIWEYEYEWMNEYECMNTSEWIQLKEYKCMNMSEWIQVNMSAWIRVNEYKWINTPWHKPYVKSILQCVILLSLFTRKLWDIDFPVPRKVAVVLIFHCLQHCIVLTWWGHWYNVYNCSLYWWVMRNRLKTVPEKNAKELTLVWSVSTLEIKFF